MSERKCTNYMLDYSDEDNYLPPCHCPVCGGFLAWEDDEPKCNKCGADLIMLPDHDEETGEELECGRICPISERKKVKNDESINNSVSKM